MFRSWFSGKVWLLAPVACVIGMVLLLLAGATVNYDAQAAPPPTMDALDLSKTLFDPPVGPAMVGEVVRFRIDLYNYSPLSIIELPMLDRFEGDCMTYYSAIPAPDSVIPSENLLLWYDLAPLAPGETMTVFVAFLATAACDPAFNRAGVHDAWLEQNIQVVPVVDEALVTIIEEGLMQVYLPLVVGD